MANKPHGIGNGVDLGVPVGTSIHNVCSHLTDGIHTPIKLNPSDLGFASAGLTASTPTAGMNLNIA